MYLHFPIMIREWNEKCSTDWERERSPKCQFVLHQNVRTESFQMSHLSLHVIPNGTHSLCQPQSQFTLNSLFLSFFFSAFLLRLSDLSIALGSGANDAHEYFLSLYLSLVTTQSVVTERESVANFWSWWTSSQWVIMGCSLRYNTEFIRSIRIFWCHSLCRFDFLSSV